MTRSPLDSQLIADLTETLHATQLALESALAVLRPDLLDERENAANSSQDALRRIGAKGGIGPYLADTLKRVEGDQLAVARAAVENAKKTTEGSLGFKTTLQRWDMPADAEVEYPVFDLAVHLSGSELRVTISPVDGVRHRDMLDVGFEISGIDPGELVTEDATETVERPQAN